MPKLKTRKSAAKRFKVTGSGKLLRRHTRLNHLMRKKSEARVRRLRREAEVDKTMEKRIRKLIPYQ
ncbi:50S ribosomal protein L35 [bacterium]|nr:50S ribosomal protein L35 [bacterium]